MNVVYFVWHISINHNLWHCFLYIQWTTQVWISAFSASQYIFTYLTGGWFFCLRWFKLFFAKKPIFKIYSLLTCLGHTIPIFLSLWPFCHVGINLYCIIGLIYISYIQTVLPKVLKRIFNKSLFNLTKTRLFLFRLWK